MTPVLAATPERRAAAARDVRRNIERILQRGDADRVELVRTLRDTRARIVARLAEGGTEFDAARAQSMIRSIDAEVAQLRAQMQTVMGRSLVRALTQGAADMAAQARTVLGDDLGISGTIDRTLVQFAQQNTQSLVQQIGDRARSDLRSIMLRSATGSSTTQDVAREIGDVLRGEGRDPGTFGRLADQVERVHRTETSRLYEGASEATETKVAQRSRYQMQKRWIAQGGSRQRSNHWAMNGVTIPVGEHFNLNAGASSRMSYEEAQRTGATLGLKCSGPHDSVLPAREVVNCRCTRALVRGELKEEATT